MAVTCWYVVIEVKSRWWVDCEGHSLGPFDEIADATDGAIHAAEIFGDSEKLVQVMVPDGRGHFEVAWERAPMRH